MQVTPFNPITPTHSMSFNVAGKCDVLSLINTKIMMFAIVAFAALGLIYLFDCMLPPRDIVPLYSSPSHTDYVDDQSDSNLWLFLVGKQFKDHKDVMQFIYEYKDQRPINILADTVRQEYAAQSGSITKPDSIVLKLLEGSVYIVSSFVHSAKQNTSKEINMSMFDYCLNISFSTAYDFLKEKELI